MNPCGSHIPAFGLFAETRCTVSQYEKKKYKLWRYSLRWNNVELACTQHYYFSKKLIWNWVNIVRAVKSRRMRWAGHVPSMEEGRGVHKVLVGKPEGKRPLERLRRRWEDNIKMDLEEGGRGCGDWMELAEDRDRWRALVSTVINFRGSIKCGEFFWLAAKPVSFARRTLLHGISK